MKEQAKEMLQRAQEAAKYCIANNLITKQEFEELKKDYFSHAYGEDWRLFRDYMQRILDALPYAFFSRDAARLRKNVHYDPAQAEKMSHTSLYSSDEWFSPTFFVQARRLYSSPASSISSGLSHINICALTENIFSSFPGLF